MALNFNPSLWFICKFCREPFSNTDKLKAHKLESHLGECLNIKCIVFEEKLLDYEWISPTEEFYCNQSQLLNLNNSSIKSSHIKSETTTAALQGLEKINKFQNPYVSLKLLTAQELSSASAPRIHEGGSDCESKSTVGAVCNFGLTETHTTISSKRKQSFASQVCPYSPLPLKQPETDGKNDDDLHKNKIRELLSNAVIIKSEPTNDDSQTDSRVFLEPPDLPIPAAAAVTTSLKVEFIDYDLIANQKVEIVSTEQHEQLLRTNTVAQLPAESDLFNSGRSRKSVKSIICQICSASFSRNQKLTEHMLRHSDHRPVECPQCDSKFKTKSNLRAHLKKFHNPSSPFRCQFCGKTFTTTANLDRHELLIHTAERPFQCDFPNCGAEFMSQNQLDSHKRNVHAKDLGLPQFVCSTCGKSFGHRKALNVHIRWTHINVRKDFTHLTHILP